MEYGNGPFHPYPYLSGNVPPQPIYNGYNTSNSAFFFPQPPNPSPITESYGSSGSYRTDISSYQDNMSGRWIQPPDYRPTGYRQVLVNPDQDDLVIERSYTPSFQGSGPPIYPDESHDEMRPIVAFCMTAEQLNVAEKLQAILNQLNLLSGEMREPLKELSARPGKEEDSLREFPTKKAITPKNLIANEDPMRIVVNTSNKLIRKPKSVTVSGDSCGPDVQSNDVLVVDSSKQSVRSLTNWAPTINTKKRKVGHIPSVPGSFSSDSSATKWVKPIDLNKSTDSVPLSNEREEESVQWYDSRIVMPIPLKIEGDAVILHEEPNTFERTPREEEFPSVKNGKSGSETLLNATQNTYSTSNLNSCQLSSRGRNDDSRSQERNYLEGPYSSKGSYSLRIIKGHRIHGDSRVCYAHLEGKCTAGIFCRFDHSGTVKRSCSRLLRGVCRPDNKSCSAPHYNLLKHQYPVCSFYLRGDCSAWPKCLLLHVKHSPGTTFCSDFGKGSCFRGIECEYVHSYQRHVIKSVEDFGFSQPDDENREVERDIDNTETGILNWIED